MKCKKNLPVNNYNLLNSVITCFEDELYEAMQAINWTSIPVILHSIDFKAPCILTEWLKIKPHLSQNEGWKIYEQNNENIDVFGLYFPCPSKYYDKGKHIVIDTDKIYEYSNHDETTFLIITTIIMLHEYAHAIMDITAPCEEGSDSDKNHDIKETLFDSLYEESYTNMITIHFFDRFLRTNMGLYSFHREREDNLKLFCMYYSNIIDFISKQPFEYRMGIRLYKNRIWYWKIWKEFKKTKHSSSVIYTNAEYILDHFYKFDKYTSEYMDDELMKRFCLDPNLCR